MPQRGVISRELEETILNIIISPGIVSVSAHPITTAVSPTPCFYGMTSRSVSRAGISMERWSPDGMLVNLGRP